MKRLFLVVAVLAAVFAAGSREFFALDVTNSGTSISGNAGTATALLSNGSNCSAGQYPLGVSAAGAAESCASALLGVTDASDATAGDVGQLIVSSAAATNFPASGSYGDFVSMSLTAGDWDISLIGGMNDVGASITVALISVSSSTGNDSSSITLENTSQFNAAVDLNPTYLTMVVPPYRVSLSSTKTYYMKYYATYSVATPTLQGRMTARRVR